MIAVDAMFDAREALKSNAAEFLRTAQTLESRAAYCRAEADATNRAIQALTRSIEQAWNAPQLEAAE